MSLDKKSLTELRGIAQVLGFKFQWVDSKEKLLDRIQAHVTPAITTPIPFKSDTPNLSEPEGNNQQAIIDALKAYTDRGLIITFPTPDTWQIYCNSRYDSGHLSTPLRIIAECAKALLTG